MREAVTNTSPLVYLHRAGALPWLGTLDDSLWVPTAVLDELGEGQRLGYDVPLPDRLSCFEPKVPERLPSQWLALDLGPGELAALALALDHPQRIVLLDDQLARRTAVTAGLTVWGTLRIVPEAKRRGLTPTIAPVVDRLRRSGLWMSDSVRLRILHLADE